MARRQTMGQTAVHRLGQTVVHRVEADHQQAHQRAHPLEPTAALRAPTPLEHHPTLAIQVAHRVVQIAEQVYQHLPHLVLRTIQMQFKVNQLVHQIIHQITLANRHQILILIQKQ